MVNFVQQVDQHVKINNVLVSVSDKSALDVLIPGLVAINPEITFYSTGGTFKRISEILGPDKAEKHLVAVSNYTGQPETQGGLVKTLDFKIYLGLLTETYNDDHQSDLVRTQAIPLDMVVVNLYPFKATVAQPDVTVEKARANIDIGGPCMLRASAKNYLRVLPVVNPADYPDLLEMLKDGSGTTDLATRFRYACKAFAHTAQYDKAISDFLEGCDPSTVDELYELMDL